MERDETVGPIISYWERFQREVGRPPHEALGLSAPAAEDAEDD
jgi:hypothetical protein